MKDVQPTLVAYVHQELTSSYASLVEADIASSRETLQSLIDQQIWHQIEDANERRDVMVSIALLESSLSWFETQKEPHTIDFATSMIWNLELEDDAGAAIERIQSHLTELLRDRVDH